VKALYYDRQGSLDFVTYGDFPDPAPKADECLIRVRAAALNGFEPMMILHKTGLRTPLPMIPCGDVVGEVAHIGADVADKSWRVGDRVLLVPYAGSGMMGETMLGGACELVCVTGDRLIRIPDQVADENAACTIIAYGTAYRMITIRGRILAGERVLILGATGGVGVACVQFATQAGAEVIACGSADWKLRKLETLGAQHVIDTGRVDFLDWIHDHFGKPHVSGVGGGGVDVVINYIGGDTWIRALKTLKRHGRMLTCGATAGYDPPTDLRYIWSFELTVIGSNGWAAEDPLTLLALMADGKLKPVIHAVRPMSEGRQAIQDLVDRKIFGKVVLVP
jgi:alcohol dehydrogenase